MYPSPGVGSGAGTMPATRLKSALRSMRGSRISQASSVAWCATWRLSAGRFALPSAPRNSWVVQTGAAMPRAIWYFRGDLHQFAGLAARAGRPCRCRPAARNQAVRRVTVRERDHHAGTDPAAPGPADRMARKARAEMHRRGDHRGRDAVRAGAASISSCATAAGCAPNSTAIARLSTSTTDFMSSPTTTGCACGAMSFARGWAARAESSAFARLVPRVRH